MTRRQKPDLLFVTLIHQALRMDADRLVAAASALQSTDIERIAGLRRFFDEYRGQLDLHHAHENDLFFPALRAVVDESQAPIAELTAQHALLDAALQSVADGFTSMSAPSSDFAAGRVEVVSSMIAMAKHLDAHLTMEEETVLPLMASSVPRSTYKQLEAQARRLTPRRRARFLIPWIIGHATPDQQRALFESAPPLRVANLVSRRRYRLVERALLLTPDPTQCQQAFDG